MGEYLYRTQEEYKNGEAIKCTNPESKVTIKQHIENGSKKNSKGSRFISTTGKISIAKYKYSQTKNKRNPIILIDLKKLKELKAEKIYDFRTDESLLNMLTGKGKNYVKADRETTIESDIPAECCKKIPPLIADILSAFELDGPMGVLIDPINDMIMNDSIYGEIERILAGIEFNDLEKEFIKEYYSDSMPTLEEIGKKFFPENEQSDIIAQCLQIKVLKNIFQSKEFIEFLKNKMQGSFPKGLKEKVNRLKIKFENGIKLDKRLLQCELRPQEEIKTHAPLDGKSFSQSKRNRYYIGNYGSCLFVDLKLDTPPIESPQDIEYICGEDGKVIKVIAKYSFIEKRIEGEPPTQRKTAYGDPKLYLIESSVGKKKVKESAGNLQQEKQEHEIEELLEGKGTEESGSNILTARKIGESSLNGIDGKSLMTVARREEFGVKKSADASKQNCSSDLKNIDSSKIEKSETR